MRSLSILYFISCLSLWFDVTTIVQAFVPPSGTIFHHHTTIYTPSSSMINLPNHNQHLMFTNKISTLISFDNNKSNNRNKSNNNENNLVVNNKRSQFVTKVSTT